MQLVRCSSQDPTFVLWTLSSLCRGAYEPSAINCGFQGTVCASSKLWKTLTLKRFSKVNPPASFLILFTMHTCLIQPHSEATRYQHHMPWSNRNQGRTLVIKPLLCRKSNGKTCLCRVPKGTSSIASPPSSPPFSCGWSICPHLGALISHIFTHHVYPAHCAILRHLMICKPAQQLQCAVSHHSRAALTSVFSASDKPTFHPSPGARVHASTHPPFHVVCALDVGGVSSSRVLPAEFKASAPLALPQPNEIILLAGGCR